MKKTPGTLIDNAGGWYAVTESDVLRLCGTTKLVLFICITSVQCEQIKYSKVLFLVIQILFILLQKQKPTGGVPGKDMRIKESDLLKRLATDSGKTANQVAEIIISELLKNKVIEDTPENWGVSVFDAINEDVTEEQTANCYAAISEALGVYLKRVYFIVPDLDLMGNDDCPECGGEMEVTDGEYKQTGGDGYLTPPEYTAIWEEMTCTHCGHKESNEPSY